MQSVKATVSALDIFICKVVPTRFCAAFCQPHFFQFNFAIVQINVFVFRLQGAETFGLER